MDENFSTEDNLDSFVKADDDLQKTENGLIFNPYNPINKYPSLFTMLPVPLLLAI